MLRSVARIVLTQRPVSILIFVFALFATAIAGSMAGNDNAAAPPPEPDNYRTDEYRKPVPLTLKGAKVIDVIAAEKLWTSNEATFIDVYPHAPKPKNLPAGTYWREPPHYTIERAVWLPNVGYGALSPANEAYFKTSLAALTKGDPTQQIVLYCLRNCWMSWNAAKRALSYGYSNVLWFSEGTDAWQEAGLPIESVRPIPGGPGSDDPLQPPADISIRPAPSH